MFHSSHKCGNLLVRRTVTISHHHHRTHTHCTYDSNLFGYMDEMVHLIFGFLYIALLCVGLLCVYSVLPLQIKSILVNYFS